MSGVPTFCLNCGVGIVLVSGPRPVMLCMPPPTCSAAQTKGSVQGMAALLAVSTSCRAPQGRAVRKLTCTCEAHAWCAGWYPTLRTVWRQRALRALPSNGVGYHVISAERHSVGRVIGTIALLVEVTSARTPSLAGVQKMPSQLQRGACTSETGTGRGAIFELQ